METSQILEVTTNSYEKGFSYTAVSWFKRQVPTKESGNLPGMERRPLPLNYCNFENHGASRQKYKKINNRSLLEKNIYTTEQTTEQTRT